MSFIRYVVLGLLLISIGLALNVNVPTQLQTVSKGQVANFPITIINNENGTATVVISAASEAPVSTSDQAFSLNAFQSRTVNVFAITSDLGEGVYLIAVKINDGTYNLAVNVRENTPILRFDPIYDTLEITQGEYQDLKFLVRNEGQDRLRNIVIEGDIPTSLNAEYPEPFDLAANQIKQIKIRVHVPSDYRPDEYELMVKAGAGNLEEKTTVILKVIKGESLKNKLSISVLGNWEAVKEENTDNIIGYSVPFRITNNGISDLSGITWKLSNLPSGWEVNDNESFTVKGFETKDIALKFITKDFGAHTVNVTLMKGLDNITTTDMTFDGFKVGAGTGFVILGGDAFIGLVVLVIIAVAVMFVRRRNAKQEVVEETETRSYLEKLVEESKVEEPKTATKTKASRRK